jgi:ABC-type maltose transport system permease subunit
MALIILQIFYALWYSFIPYSSIWGNISFLLWLAEDHHFALFETNRIPFKIPEGYTFSRMRKVYQEINLKMQILLFGMFSYTFHRNLL